jgi:4-amino-4-deoxy-L-arabinose transferase-like glycosyltransferase
MIAIERRSIQARSRIAAVSLALLPLALFLGALFLRLYALAWGLPYVEHVDEPALVEVSVRMVQNADLNPHTFLYPSLYYYLIAGAAWLHATWGIQHGLYSSLQSLPLKTYGFTTAPALYLWERSVTALMGAATIPALYLLGRRMFDLRVGILGGLALAVTHYHIINSHYITADAPTGLWVVLAVLGAWMVATNGDWRGYLLAGAATGLAGGTKYNAVVAALALVLAHLLYWGRAGIGRALLRLIAAGGLSLLVFVATTPYALLDWSDFLAALRSNANHYATGTHGNFRGPWNLGGYVRFIWNSALYHSGSIVAALGLLALARRYPRPLTLLLGVTLAELALLLPYSVNFVRNLLPVIPLMILLAAAGVVALADLIRPKAAHLIAFALLVVALLAPQINRTIWHLHYWSQPYTLVAATEQLRALPQGMRSAAEVNGNLWTDDPVFFPVALLADHPAEWYRANGFRYLLLNSDNYPTPAERVHYDQLKAAGVVVADYPERSEGLQPGPASAIVDLGEHPELMPFVQHELRFGGQAALLGYEIMPGPPRAQVTPLGGANTRELRSGDPLQLNLYWRALARMDRDYTLFIHIIDQRDQTVAQRDLPLRHSDYPTSHWQPGELVVDQADLPLPALPPGSYRIDLGLYDGATGARLPVQVGDGAAASNTLTTLTIK